MEAVMFILPVATGIGLIFLAAFYWAYKSGQFEDMEGPAARVILQDDEQPPKG